MSRASEPVSAAEAVARLSLVLASYPSILLAVSGGPDSMALLTFAGWASREGALAGKSVLVASVDHGLRAGSAGEADRVAAHARSLGFEHQTLVWAGSKPATGLQEAAREARYDLLAGCARAMPARPVAIVTAHHADDQAETLLMRLGRGSGLSGLAGMRRVTALDEGIDLVRPLLDMPKARLAATLAQHAISWIEDPSNAAPCFERTRLRDNAAAVAALGLTNDALAVSARRLARADDALSAVTAHHYRRIVAEHGGAYAAIETARFDTLPDEVRVRLLSRVLERFGWSARPIRLRRIEDLISRLEARLPLEATLGGCAIVRTQDALLILREAGRSGLPRVGLTASDSDVLWDGRFRVSIARPREGMTLRALGPDGIASLKALVPDLSIGVPHGVALTLPSLWVDGRPAWVPHLDFDATGGLHPRLSFHPSRSGLGDEIV